MVPCDVAVDGPSGLAMIMSRIEQAKDSEMAVSNYKIIFIDYHMPQMLGTVVASTIIRMCTDAQVERPKMFCCTAEDDSSALR